MENYITGDKIRVIDPKYKNDSMIWNRDLYVAFTSKNIVHATDNLAYPIFFHYFGQTQIKKIKNEQKENKRTID
jgi:hypothetical protein